MDVMLFNMIKLKDNFFSHFDSKIFGKKISHLLK